MALTPAMNLLVKEFVKELHWRELCYKSGVDPKDVKMYEPKPNDKKPESKDDSI